MPGQNNIQPEPFGFDMEFELLGDLEDELEEQFEAPFPGLPIPGTIHRLDCPAGCPPVTAAECRRVVRQAISEAIKMAENAASRLENAVKPGARDKEAQETARLFTFFFGHDPSRLVPWANNKPSGANVAERFRLVEGARGRTTNYLSLQFCCSMCRQRGCHSSRLRAQCDESVRAVLASSCEITRTSACKLPGRNNHPRSAAHTLFRILPSLRDLPDRPAGDEKR